MSVYVYAAVLPPVNFNGGYVQATKSLSGKSWRVTVFMERQSTHIRTATRVCRSEENARKAAQAMADFWSKDNPEFTR